MTHDSIQTTAFYVDAYDEVSYSLPPTLSICVFMCVDHFKMVTAGDSTPGDVRSI
jgi:hypothetical protein